MEPDPTFTQADVLAIMSGTPERIRDLVSVLDEERLAYRHGPAFPTLSEVILHVWAAGVAADAVVKGVAQPGSAPGDPDAALDPPATDGAAPVGRLADLARDRRRTMDLLRGLDQTGWETEVHGDRSGPLLLLDFCRLVAAHEMGHLSQIRNLTSLLPE